MKDYYAITDQEFDTDAIIEAISSPDTGGVAAFIGMVRGRTSTPSGNDLTDYLFYEAYEEMADQKLRLIASEIREKYPAVQGVAIVQRIGTLEIGEFTVLVACSSGHRDQGIFEAARYGIDRLKEIVPVWKKEIRNAENPRWVEGHFRPDAE